MQVRLSQFIDKFDLFRPVLEAWENGFDVLQLYELLDAAISGDQDRGKTYADALQWTEEYGRLVKGLSYVTEKTAGEEMRILYECFQSYLAGNQVLSGFSIRKFPENHDRSSRKARRENKVQNVEGSVDFNPAPAGKGQSKKVKYIWIWEGIIGCIWFAILLTASIYAGKENNFLSDFADTLRVLWVGIVSFQR